MTFCKYQNLFGQPGQGIHQYRLFGKQGTTEGIALVDSVATVLAAFLLAKLFKVKFLLMLILLILLAIIFHQLFCVNTSFNKMLFG